jgi:hypothetical protein
MGSWLGAAAVAGLLAATPAQAQTILAEGFNDVAALGSAGWTFRNTSTAPGTNWMQGNPGIFTAESGLGDSFVAANFLGTTGPTGSVSNWLITPQITLDELSVVNLVVRVAGEGFVDTLQVLVSTTGTATADFSLIGSYSASSDQGWVPLSFSAGLTGSSAAYVALRYLVDDVSINGNYLGVDNLAILAVPEPTSLLLMALGLAGLAGLRQQRRNAN